MTFTRFLVASTLMSSVAQGFMVTPTIRSSLRIPQHRTALLQSSPNMAYGPANVTSSLPPSLFEDDETSTLILMDEADLWRQKQSLDALLHQSCDSTFQQPQGSSLASSLQHMMMPDDTEQTDEEKAVWNARLLLLGAAALYGTNFSFVKLLGDIMPVGISSTLRFGLAALATAPWLIPTKNDNKAAVIGATLGGLEVGMWNSIGYVAQAVGLETTDASKVRLIHSRRSFLSCSVYTKIIHFEASNPAFCSPFLLPFFSFTECFHLFTSCCGGSAPGLFVWQKIEATRNCRCHAGCLWGCRFGTRRRHG
jgi:hypothetical protein